MAMFMKPDPYMLRIYICLLALYSKIEDVDLINVRMWK